MSTNEATKVTQEYRNIPIAQLKESSTNPRKTFDEKGLQELAESIRSKGVLLPLLVRPVNGHYEIVTGERRYRASKLAGRGSVPATVRELSDEECLEIQLIENLLRMDLHPFEEAQGFRALLDREQGAYTIEKLAAKTGKSASFIAKRLCLLDLIPPVADAFTAGQIGVEHALLIAKLAPEAQEEALRHCFDGYYAAEDKERSLVPASRLQTWIEHNVYLSLKSVPFSKDDETLVPEAGSCANCPKRTGFNRLLFSEVREDSDCCTNAACFNRKLDAHIAQRVAKMPNLVQISHNYRATDETSALPRREYVEVVARKSQKGRDAHPEHKLCNHLKPAIHTDGKEKGRLVKVCANPECKIHFGNRQKEEEQQLRWKAEQLAANRKAKQTVTLRHRMLGEILKRAKPPFGTGELRVVAQHLVGSLSHDLACRLAKRHGFEPSKKGQEWELADKARSLYKTANGAPLAALVWEAMLLPLAANTTEAKDDLLSDAAKLYKLDVKALRKQIENTEKEKTLKLKAAMVKKAKTSAKAKQAHK
ncbi:MAG TPA: ParB/RepB/Spo0J family partition protein [Candidatus Acidoferrum sp.]|nr:ParB/RepB/Spo0J family partition protein [Candidatus Acidoferrum sp.]